jgi:hypothetical protein
MTITREEIAAFADGELEPQRATEVAAAVAADPLLAGQVRAHRELRERLGGHFAAILAAPLPERLTSLLPQPPVASLAAAREKRERARTVPRWSWFAGPALAASLAFAVISLPRTGADYASGEIAAALDQQLVAQQSPDDPVQVLLSFKEKQGAYCRAFVSEMQHGIACRDDQGWRLRVTKPGGGPPARGEFRMAGSESAALLERAQAIASGPALDAAEEAVAQARSWR